MQRYFDGSTLYGDDFDDARIADWFAGEQTGYFDISAGHAQNVAEYDALNRMTLFRHLRGANLGPCIAIGCAAGHDIAPLAGKVSDYLCVEPSEQFWRPEIGGKPAVYRKPTLRGSIDVPDGSAGVVVAIAVLHHIPNVTEVVGELARVLKPGGFLLIKEPVVSMGDWRTQRPGLTKNERGIPDKILLKAITQASLKVEKETYCDFSPISTLARIAGVRAYQNPVVTRLDLIASFLMRWNCIYHRTSMLRKFAPASLAIVARK